MALKERVIIIKKFTKLILIISAMLIFAAVFAVYAIGAFGGRDNNADSTLALSTSTIETAIALPTASNVFVNGEDVSFDAFNIGGFNYFKLRDIAYTLSGTTRQFDVGWDNENNAILLTSDSPYTIVGSEMAHAAGGNKQATPSTTRIYLDSNEVQLTAYNIEGSNYFMLRDIGQVIDFYVNWDEENERIIIDTREPFGDSTIAFNANFIRTDFFDWNVPSGNKVEEPTVVTSRNEYEQYLRIFEPVDFDNRVSDALLEMYTDDFFVDNYLVIISVVENSGSIYHEVESVSADGEIVVRRHIPEMGTADMAQHLIMVELNNDFLPAEFSVTFNNVDPGADSSESDPVNIEYQRITAEEAKEMMGSGEPFILLDVRTDEEFRYRRIEGAILIPDFEIASRAPAELPDKSMLILIYCRTGRRSHDAAWELIDMGYTNVYDFGGIVVWPFDTISG